MKNNKLLGIVGFIIFLGGILLGMLLFGSMTWARLESIFYFGNVKEGDSTLKLTCPRLMTAAEPDRFTAYFRNPDTGPTNPLIETEVSNHLAVRTDRFNLTIAPQSTQEYSQELSSDDVVFGHLVMVYVYQFRTAVIDSADATCGIVFVNIPWADGPTVFYGAIALILLALGGGFALWAANNRPLEGRNRERKNALLLLAGVVLLGVIVAWIGWWVLGVILTALSVLALVIILANYSS